MTPRDFYSGFSMKSWNSKKKEKHGVWGNEIRLRNVSARRLGNVKKLLTLLKDEVDETVL